VLFGFANDDRARIAGGRIDGADALSELEDWRFIGAVVGEVGFHGLKLFAFGGEGPGAEVVKLFVDVVADGAVRMSAALGFENAHGAALALHSVVLVVDGDKDLIEKNYGGGISGCGWGWRLGGVNRPIRGGLRMFSGGRWRSGGEGYASGHNGQSWKTARTRVHQLPFAAEEDAVRTSCCLSETATFW
jgi:hypothetical protein